MTEPKPEKSREATFAQKLYETCESLAPSFNVGHRVPWGELPEEHRKMHVAAVRLVLNEMFSPDSAEEQIVTYLEKMATCPTGQHIEFDRNLWQRRLGVLLTIIEETAGYYSERTQGLITEAMSTLKKRAYAVVNTNPYSGKEDEDSPWSTLSMRMVRHTLEAALNAGLVAPGPHAPDWMVKAHPSRQPNESGEAE